MTAISTVFVSDKQIEATQTTQYTSTQAKSIVDKCTVTNTTASAVTLSISIVKSGSSASALNTVASNVSILPGQTYFCPEVMGARLNAGDFISMIAGTANALSLRMDGRQVQ